jgi:predicted CoA-substrate-specific enzyme activase
VRRTVFIGIDVGASATKGIVLDSAGKVKARSLWPSGFDFEEASKRCYESLKDLASFEDEETGFTVSTGYGRKNVDFADSRKTEIACHGRGCYHFFPEAITIVDIGAQDNKIIVLGTDGIRQHFRMNRKCAAGTGAFLEEIALQMNVSLSRLHELASSARDAVILGSFCTVFSKTEILALVRKGVDVRALARGAYESVIKRILEMDPLRGKVVLTGGVAAHNPLTAEILSQHLEREVFIPPDPQYTGAFGAALYAMEEYGGARAS